MDTHSNNLKNTCPIVNEQTGEALSASPCCASDFVGEIGLDDSIDPLASLRRTGLWVDEETYIDYELIETEFGDRCEIKPNSTSDTEGIVKSLKHLSRAQERREMGKS